MMQLIPAIDLLDGRCVRLRQGDFDQVQYYEMSAAELAETYHAAGTEWLHVVDLAASRDGENADTYALFELLCVARQQVQTGGGVRSLADVRARLDAGASRVVVGSVAAESPELFSDWLEQMGPENLVAALDVQYDKSGVPQVRTHGWKQSSGKSLWELLDQYTSSSLRHVLCTDIGRDGLLSGPNQDLYREICARYPTLQVQASGGVSSISDLQALIATGVAGAISGKALLDGLFSVAEATSCVEISG